MIIHLFHSFMMSFVLKVSGPTTNLATILKFLFGKIILLYRFMNFTRAILLYIIARCLPIQLLAPKLNPPITNDGSY